ncbi:MAG: 3-dehydroquinate synthase [Ruminococcaceae bacterium]|nr:3-dehydroquinate synthase [Oscillospiraceae bacterium]
MTVTMNLLDRGYDIVIERGAINAANKLLNLNRNVLIVTDDGVPLDYAECIAKQCLNPVIVIIKQGEESKSIAEMENLCRVMLNNGFTRKDCVVAVGGGVVGDLAGFCAASYMRGIDFYNIPTTLLSQVDSSIGGKVAVNLDKYKNIIGAFYQPKKVIIDPLLLNTLPERQFSNGMAEAIKMSLTSDKELFNLIENSDIEANIDTIIEKSLNIKKYVVENDERENGLRKILNFGHTIGHAIESVEFGNLYHGECVALGMLYVCSEEVKKRLIKVLNKVGLPTQYEFDKEVIKANISHDKKSEGDVISGVFVEEIGAYKIKNLSVEEFANLI